MISSDRNGSHYTHTNHVVNITLIAPHLNCFNFIKLTRRRELVQSFWLFLGVCWGGVCIFQHEPAARPGRNHEPRRRLNVEDIGDIGLIQDRQRSEDDGDGIFEANIWEVRPYFSVETAGDVVAGGKGYAVWWKMELNGIE